MLSRSLCYVTTTQLETPWACHRPNRFLFVVCLNLNSQFINRLPKVHGNCHEDNDDAVAVHQRIVRPKGNQCWVSVTVTTAPSSWRCACSGAWRWSRTPETCDRGCAVGSLSPHRADQRMNDNAERLPTSGTTELRWLEITLKTKKKGSR